MISILPFLKTPTQEYLQKSYNGNQYDSRAIRGTFVLNNDDFKRSC